MEKVVTKLILFVVVFAGAWFLTYQINWMEVFEIEKTSQNLESKLGELYWESIEKTEEILKNDSIVDRVDSVLVKICKANDIDRDKIKLHIVNTSEVNAFTLPDDHMILNTGLILSSESAEEMAGVICHELAHMTENHVMEKLMKEIGLNVLVSMTTGSGGEVIRETASVLTSFAFDREMETEADEKAVDYLIEAGINPEGFADFMYRLSQKEDELIQTLSWLSTHPLSEDRAIHIVEYSNEIGYEKDSLMSAIQWNDLQEKLNSVLLED